MNNSIIQSFVLFGIILLLHSCQNAPQKKQKNVIKNGPNYKGMVFVSAGEFQMGGKSAQAYEDELPRHKVFVDAFYMDEHEVTNTNFKKFVDATGYQTVAERPIDWEELKLQVPPNTPKPADSLLQPGALVFIQTEVEVDLNYYMQWWKWKIGANWRHPEGPNTAIDSKMNHPVVHIAYEDAIAYSKWADKRLPTEAEWEWAASGGKDSNKYPWGNKPINESYDKANFWQGIFPYINSEKDGFLGTAPVKSFPPNAFGIYDMAGNVWELCSDKYSADAYSQAKKNGLVKNPAGPLESFNPLEPYQLESYVVKGGSFLCNDDYCSGYRVARRMGIDPYSGAMHTGFRCVKD
jgi:sulfatase modifying factor 1